MEITVEPNKMYAVTTSGSCTVVDADGLELCTANSGQQSFFVATTSTVTISDDSAKVSRANFKNALAVAGLLGGGDKLPTGYTQADFILKDDLLGDDCLLSNEVFTHQAGVRLVGYKYVSHGGQAQRIGVHEKCYLEMTNRTTFTVGIGSSALFTLPVSVATRYVWTAFYKGSDIVKLETDEGAASGTSSYVFKPTVLALFGCPMSATAVGYTGRGRVYELKISEGSVDKYIFRPCVSPEGVMTFYCTKTGKLMENYAVSVRNRVGLTNSQAVTLCRNLSNAGGSLKVVLPSGYDTDEKVINALANAEAKGWQITIQTYEGASAATTYALRRVWVRKTCSERGEYVDADGTRWQVEWCVDVIGADPETLGFERFRSVDAATEYWGLVPYEYPEELSTEA
jgi:hypothetical protein